MSMVSNGYSESYSIASSTKSSAKIQVSHKTYQDIVNYVDATFED